MTQYKDKVEEIIKNFKDLWQLAKWVKNHFSMY